jgi:hypothetical protein
MNFANFVLWLTCTECEVAELKYFPSRLEGGMTLVMLF